MPLTSLIPVGAWLWDKYGKSVTNKTSGAIRGQWDKFRWADAADKYRSKVKKLYGTMQIMGMAEPVPLDDIFTDAYMLDRPTASSRFDIERLKQLSADPDAPTNAERINGLRLVVEKGNLFILGKPGAGKTTFLKYIALKAAEQTIDKIPIFVSLKNWADSGMELMPFIADRFDICDFPAARPFAEELLKSGNAVVLFDGLDEVNQESGQRDMQTRAIDNFVQKYDLTQCLITCRIAASDYSFERFTHVEIADFTEKQIEIFVGNWFRNDEGEKDEDTSKRFLAEFRKEDNRGLLDLARTPLLLTLLCLAFDETLAFPQRRVEIYQEALDALLKKWDSSRRIKRDEVYRRLSLGHKENMLARIAAETFEDNRYFISQPELEKLILDYMKKVPPHDTNSNADGAVILKAIEAQHGVFVERSRGIYSFSHLTLHEYFTAKNLVADAAKGTLTDLVNKHCADIRWREVLLLTTSMLTDAGQFINAFRRSIDKLLADDKGVRAVLAWANKKSASIKFDSWLMRSCYLQSGFLAGKEHSVINNVLEDEINLLTARIGRQQLDVKRAGKDSDDTTFRDFMLDRDLLWALGHSRLFDATQVAFDLESGINRACVLGLNELAAELSGLSIPSHKATDVDWLGFADSLRILALKHRDVGYDWNFTRTQEGRLIDYINGTRILKDCLDLAFMAPDEKKATLNGLYLPSAWDLESMTDSGLR